MGVFNVATNLPKPFSPINGGTNLQDSMFRFSSLVSAKKLFGARIFFLNEIKFIIFFMRTKRDGKFSNIKLS